MPVTSDASDASDASVTDTLANSKITHVLSVNAQHFKREHRFRQQQQ